MSCDLRSGYLQKSPHMCANENRQAAVSDDLPGYIMAWYLMKYDIIQAMKWK